MMTVISFDCLQSSHGSHSPRGEATHWYDQAPTNPPHQPDHNPPLPDRLASSYQSRGGAYLAQQPFNPITRKSVSNGSLASPQPYSVYHSDTETRSARHEAEPSSLTGLGPFSEGSPRRTGNGAKRPCRGTDQRGESIVLSDTRGQFQ